MKIESKPEFKARYGRSPDMADAAFLCLDLARQRHGLVAVEPLEGGESGKLSRPRRTMKHLTKVLSGQSLDGV
jgi:hypothetical protein